MPHWKELSESTARKVCGTHPGMRRVCVSPSEVLESGLTAPQLAKRWATEQVGGEYVFEVLSHTPFEPRNGEYASVYLMPRQRDPARYAEAETLPQVLSALDEEGS